MNFFLHLYEDFKAWRRGEVRVAPRGTRGRIYAPKVPSEEAPGAIHRTAAKATATLKATVTRADGTVEHFEFPAEVIQNG